LKLQQELQSYNKPGSPTHGTMLLSAQTGKFNVVQLDKMDTLQFKEVNDYICTLLANQWQYPLGRLGIKTQQATASKDSSGSSEKSYWNFVSTLQDLYVESENTLLWEPYFGVRLCADKSYLHDEVIENTAEQFRLSNLEQTMRILNLKGKALSDQAMLSILNGHEVHINEEDIEEMQMSNDGTGMMYQNQLPKKMTASEGMSNADRSQKRADEISRERNSGKPSGVN